MMCDAYMCMGTDGAWDGMGANGTLEARASDLRFVARAGRNLPLKNCVVSEPGSRGPSDSREKGAYRAAGIGLKLKERQNPWKPVTTQ